MPEARKDIWDKLSAISTAIAALVIPIVLALAANAVNASLKNQEVEVEVMKLAVDLLKTDPAEVDQPGVREWAMDVLSAYSDIPLPEEASSELSTQPLAATSILSAGRDADPAHLHPVLRERVAALLQRLESEGRNFAIFEGFRNPTSQLLYYARGRTSGGARVTNAGPWTGLHSVGLAVDIFPMTEGGVPDFSAGPDEYRRMHEIARELGLRTMEDQPFPDLPHLELEVTPADIAAGRYPPHGDDVSWAGNLAASIADWTTLSNAVAAWGATLPPAPPSPLPAAEVEF